MVTLGYILLQLVIYGYRGLCNGLHTYGYLVVTVGCISMVTLGYSSLCMDTEGYIMVKLG